MKVFRKNVNTRENTLLMLSTARLVFWLGIIASAAIFIQLFLGASLVVITLTLVSILICFLGFGILGAYNLGAWVAFFYMFGNVLIALYAKTILGQTLDSNLAVPIDTFLAVTIASCALVAALLLVRRLRVGQPLLEGVDEPHSLAFLSWASFWLGVSFWLLNRYFQDSSDNQFGGVALFRNFLLMAVIARVALLLEQSGYRRSFDFRLGIILVISVTLGVLDNAKTASALPVVSYFVTLLFYRGGLSLRPLVVLVLGSLVFSIILAPVIHGLRVMGQQKLDLGDRIELVSSVVSRLVHSPQSLSLLERTGASHFEDGYYNYFGERGVGQMILGRYASVQQLDPVISAVNQQGAWGGKAIWPALSRLVPRFIYADKPEDIESYSTLVHYRLINVIDGKFPTLPLAGQVYAAYGFVGLLIIPFFTFLIFFLVLKKIGWRLYRNVYAVFFFCDFVFGFISQGDFAQYAGAILRGFPLFTVSFWLIAICSRHRFFLRTI